MQRDEEYKQTYNEVIRHRLPTSFVAMYEKNGWLHDWYLKSFYVANTGPNIRVNSKKGSSTLQMEFCTSNNDENVLLIYHNVMHLCLGLHETDDVSRNSPTGFGRCLVNTFSICDDTTIQHEYFFEGDNSILVRFERIRYEKVINNFWK